MLICQPRKRVAICLSPPQRRSHRSADRTLAKAEEIGEVVATYISTCSSDHIDKGPCLPSLTEMMAAANRDEFDVVVADFTAVFVTPWSPRRVFERLEALGIEAVHIDYSRLDRRNRLEWLMRSVITDRPSRNHGRRVREGIAAAKAGRAAVAAGQQGGQPSSVGH